MNPRHFASDNYAGICPEAWQALAEANHGHAAGYGDDEWTRRACDLIRGVFETECEVFFVFNGTAANSLALAQLCRSYQGILCHEAAHVEAAECAAPGFFTGGAHVVPLPGPEGKLTPAVLERASERRLDLHYPKVRAITLTQATEMGTVYTPEELRAIGELARSRRMRVHMDGARFANAVASLGCHPREITWEARVDVLSFGGTKNGLPGGEAVVFFDRALAAEFDCRAKQGGQLASKMRFVAAPWVGLLQDGAWLRHAAHANRMAARLEERLRGVPGFRLLFPREANSVMVELPPAVMERAREAGWRFYTFVGETGCRLMCAWDTTEEDVDRFAADLRRLAGG
ncbi:MAG: hypothetical protein RJA22_683 [Verrucomicrobiota bacterium]